MIIYRQNSVANGKYFILPSLESQETLNYNKIPNFLGITCGAWDIVRIATQLH